VDWARVQGGTVKLKTILGYAAVALVLFFVIKNPAGAAHIVNNIGNFLASAARGFSAFFTSL
jgi:hypothetical protein